MVSPTWSSIQKYHMNPWGSFSFKHHIILWDYLIALEQLKLWVTTIFLYGKKFKDRELWVTILLFTDVRRHVLGSLDLPISLQGSCHNLGDLFTPVRRPRGRARSFPAAPAWACWADPTSESQHPATPTAARTRRTGKYKEGPLVVPNLDHLPQFRNRKENA